ncbi:SDR family oxidoreductase [Sphingobium cupriresistens]|uniref:3-beta-hydroxysteroid dehydrogenase n=1 Tax=Sphingobium cupriresistens LL01 TaxID=1420583 RepID=A0A0J7XZ55_9SPHN|nr:SDR family oxidoreductase [Sphingobium cupriresistens]KMS56807.1 3-beta-hydroxysteroid dehydrogenase [Sphingobium cupriresistens LL01]
MARVAGKIAFVTGAAAGLGEACARMLVAQGAQVVVADQDAERAREVAATMGSQAIHWAMDVASQADWIAAATMAEERYGHLDILVNNAGIVVVEDLEETSLASFQRINQIMSEGVFLGCKYMLPLLRKSQSASIVNMASTASHLGYHKYFAYAAAKGAVRSMSKAIAVECHVKGYPVRCNSVHPAGIETELERRSQGRADVRIIPKTGILPFGSNGLPQDVANLVLFLACDEARFITGSEYIIDNGATVWPSIP